MSDTPATDAVVQQQTALVVNGQYIKDLSFEAPNSPSILTELQNKQPDISVDINVITAKVEGDNIPPNVHEVVLDLRAKLSLDDKVGFLAELKYGGIFTVNVPEEHVQGILMIEAPRIMFPFARQIISDATQGGGFMPLMLQPIDFAALFQARAQHEAASLDEEVLKMTKDKVTEVKAKAKKKKH